MTAARFILSEALWTVWGRSWVPITSRLRLSLSLPLGDLDTTR